MSDDRSARLALPYLHPGQAQKEMTHNAALAILDLAVQASVVAVGVNAPPPEPADGACWIVGDAPTGAWATHAGALAGWTVGGWRFVAPREGLTAWSVADAGLARFGEGEWRLAARLPGIPDVSGGTVIDGEARVAIADMLHVLRNHGLIESE